MTDYSKLFMVSAYKTVIPGALLLLGSVSALAMSEAAIERDIRKEIGVDVNVNEDISLHAHSSMTGYRDFFYPTYHGSRLSYCTADKKICGKALATKYCKVMGYDRATRVEIEHNVGLTRYPDPGKSLQCQGWKCDGFKWITCAESLKKTPTPIYYYRYRDFESPRFENYRVAWCYANGKACGARAAHAFCRQQGYRRARGFEKDTKVLATRMIGDGTLCFGTTCQGFEKITCFR